VNANPSPPGFLTTLNFSARESVSLLRAESASVTVHGAGPVVDFVLRLAGLVLLAFIVPTLRARTERCDRLRLGLGGWKVNETTLLTRSPC
jgi:hypothetical protein